MNNNHGFNPDTASRRPPTPPMPRPTMNNSAQATRRQQPHALDRSALRRKIDRIDMDTDNWLANRAASQGVRLTDDPYLLQEPIPVLHRVHIAEPAKVAPIRASNPKASFGESPWASAAIPSIANAMEDLAQLGKNPHCEGLSCQGKETCGDRACHRHPLNPNKRTALEHNYRAHFWRKALLGLAAFWALAFWLVFSR